MCTCVLHSSIPVNSILDVCFALSVFNKKTKRETFLDSMRRMKPLLFVNNDNCFESNSLFCLLSMTCSFNWSTAVQDVSSLICSNTNYQIDVKRSSHVFSQHWIVIFSLNCQVWSLGEIIRRRKDRTGFKRIVLLLCETIFKTQRSENCVCVVQLTICFDCISPSCLLRHADRSN